MQLTQALRQWDSISRKTKLYLLCGFWLLIACLELVQDLLAYRLNHTGFEWKEVLAYKMFWLLFIPFSLALVYYWKKWMNILPGPAPFISAGALVVLTGMLHLFIFSVFLFGISRLIHDTHPWQFSWLLIEKLSNRFYIVLSVYLLILLVYAWLQQVKLQTPAPPAETITVKNGATAVPVKVDSILWISSEGPYLQLHTADSKHLVPGSLKNIIHTLPAHFKRIHRSTIVNIHMVKKLKSRMNGDYDVLMNNADLLRLSRNYTKPLKGILL